MTLYSLLMSTPPAVFFRTFGSPARAFQHAVAQFLAARQRRPPDRRPVEPIRGGRARQAYGFYGSDVDWDEIKKLPRWRRPSMLPSNFSGRCSLSSRLRVACCCFAALVMLVLSSGSKQDFKFESLAAVALLLLLSLELATKSP